MNALQHQQESFVVGVDYSELGDLAIERACEFARAHERTQLHVVHVQTAAAMPYGFQREALAVDLRGEAAPTLGLRWVSKVVPRVWARSPALSSAVSSSARP